MKKPTAYLVAALTALLALPVAIAAPAAPAPTIKSVRVTLVSALTGPSATPSTQPVDLCGTDLGTMAELNGKVFFAFGDSFGFKGPECPKFGPNWRSNLLAATGDRDPSDGVKLDWWLTNPAGTAIAMQEGRHEPPFSGADGEQSRIPTAMIALNGVLYTHFMSVHGFAAKGGEWSCNSSSFASSKDAGNTWTPMTGVVGGPDSNFNMLALSAERGGGNENGKYVYALGTPCGRFDGVKVARFLPADILRPAAWSYYSAPVGAKPAWSAKTADAKQVIPPDVGEASVLWNPWLKRWMYTYLNEGTASLELREAPAPWGPWSSPVTLAAAATYPQLYGAFMTPSFLKDGGKTLYFIMSQFGPYNTFVMKASLEK